LIDKLQRLQSGKVDLDGGGLASWGGRHPEIYDSRVEGAWTVDKSIYAKYGEKGLHLAGGYIQKIVELCAQKNIKLYIVVYPWPTQIYFRDINSIQVRYWKEFAVRNRIDFVDLFPDFMKLDPGATVDVPGRNRETAESLFVGIDLFPPFVGRAPHPAFRDIYMKYFIPDDVHWNPAGHVLVARIIADALVTVSR